MSRDDPFLEPPPNVPPGERKDTDYSPSSDRDVEALQDDQAGSPALADPDIDRSKVKLLPGTGRGLGRAIAVALAGAGADIGLGLRDPADDDGAVAEIEALGRRAVPLAMDVLDVDASRAALDAAVVAPGRPP